MAPKVSNEVQIALINQSLKNIESKVNNMDTKLDSNFITKDEFEAKFSPVRNVVYGMVGIILLAVVTALVALVVLPKS